MSADRPVIPEEYWEAAHIFCNMLRRALAMSEAQKEEGAKDSPAPIASEQSTTIVTEAAAVSPIEREKAA